MYVSGLSPISMPWKVVKNENTQFPLKFTKLETLGEELNNLFFKILQVTLMQPNIWEALFQSSYFEAGILKLGLLGRRKEGDAGHMVESLVKRQLQ